MFISNIETTHPGATKLLKAGAISAAKSEVKGSRIPNDLTVETGVNKHGKSRAMGGGGAGFSGMLTTESTLQRFVRTTHIRAAMHRELLRFADLETNGAQDHRSTRPLEIARQEADVCEVIDVLKSRFMNPFDVNNSKLIEIILQHKPLYSSSCIGCKMVEI